MTRDEWLAQIEQNPHDWQMALIAADEIESDGDELFAEQLRFAVQFNLAEHLLSGREKQFSIVLDLRWLKAGLIISKRNGKCRADERQWCEANNVRFIPFFPRTLQDVYAGRELV